jgi:galactokinase
MPISVTRLSSVRLASSLFESSFASRPAVAATAPGRVNLIGEHTDYNGGPVLPLAVERRTAVLAAREDGWFLVSALDGVVRGVEIEGPLRRDWTDYVVGVVRELRVLGSAPAGARIAVASTLPAGAGLSSSAALTAASSGSNIAERLFSQAL